MKVLIVGGGAHGLSAARALLKSGHDVELRYAVHPFQSTSSVAGAILVPWSGLHPENSDAAINEERFERTLKVFGEEYHRYGSEATGINTASGYVLFRSAPARVPECMKRMPGFRIVGQDEMRMHGFNKNIKAAWFLSTYIVTMPIYLRFLVDQVQRLGGKLQRELVTSERLAEYRRKFDVVVPCVGLGAKELLADQDVHAARGQVVHLDAPHVTHFYIEEHQFQPGESNSQVSYIFPRKNVLLVGGTYYRDDYSDWNQQEQDRIIRDAHALVPSLNLPQCKVVRGMSGLRPARSQVMLKKVPGADGLAPLVCDYGHGGQGILLLHGCTQEVERLVSGVRPSSKL